MWQAPFLKELGLGKPGMQHAGFATSIREILYATRDVD